MKSVPAIAFDCRPSRLSLLATSAVAVLALIAVAACGLPAWLKFVLLPLVVGHALHSVRRLLAPDFAQATWHSAGHWRLRRAAGRECVAELVHSVVLGGSIVLVLRIDARRTTALLLLPDNCDGETRRRLRVRLARSIPVGASA